MNGSFIRLHSLAAQNLLIDHSLWIRDSIFEKIQTTSRSLSSSDILLSGALFSLALVTYLKFPNQKLYVSDVLVALIVSGLEHVQILTQLTVDRLYNNNMCVCGCILIYLIFILLIVGI